MDKFEIESCIKWIQENNFHVIALQVPDDDLDKVQDLIDILTSSSQNENVEFFLVGDGCSPCCNDLLNAQYCQAQGLIHFGHSCLTSSSEDNQKAISIFYVFYQQLLPEDAATFLSTNGDNEKPYYLVFYDPCFRDAIEQYSTLPHFIFSKIRLQNTDDDLSYFSLYGRSAHLPVPLNPSNYSIIFISHSKASLNNFALYFYAYDFRSFPTNSLSSSKLLSKRMYAIESARNGSSYGLLISSNSLLNLPATIHILLDRIKQLLEKNNRQHYTFLMNTLSIAKLNNFEKAIDIYVLCSSCSETIWLSPEHKQFNIPLVSITDIVHAFEEIDENAVMNYSFDMRQILSTMKSIDENSTNENEDNQAVVLKHPNALLLKQRDGTNSRPWWGLQITDSTQEETEIKSIAELKEGKSDFDFLIYVIFTSLFTRFFKKLHTCFNHFVVFNINTNVILRWLFSLLITNYPRAYRKMSREETESSLMEETTDIKRSKKTSSSLTRYFPSINLMQFAEIAPLNTLSIPHPRSGHRAVATESDLWIWGGYYPAVAGQEQRMFNELWRFNYAVRQWTLETTTGDGPTLTLASHSMCLYRNLLFVFGGTGYPFGQNVSNELFILDLKRRHWRRCQLLNEQPEQVYGASMIIKDDHLYILCGTNSWRYNSDVYDIHLSTLISTHIGTTFDEIEDFNEGGRYRQEAYLHDNQIFLFGGGGSSGVSFSLENLPVFDIAARKWSFVRTNPDPIHKFPNARKFHSIFPFGKNKLIIFGGAYFDQTISHHVLVDGHLWIFDFDNLEWSLLPSLTMPKPTYFHAAAMNVRGEIWTHGGVVHETTSRETETRITTLYKMHSRVLNLSELTWNYFLNCLSDRTCLLTQPQLMSQLNIPAKFAERIH